MRLALDLFCGGGGASMGLYNAGYTVVGVDILPQPKYPFTFIQADAVTFSLDGFDFIWASPPCQKHTKAAEEHRKKGKIYPCYIEPIRKKLKKSGKPYVIENVPGAPLLNPIELCGAMFGLKVYRHRHFETSFPCEAPPHHEHKIRQIKMGRPVTDKDFIQVVGHFSGVPLARKAMGIDWLGQKELAQAIPPAYAEYIAKQYQHVERVK